MGVIPSLAARSGAERAAQAQQGAERAPFLAYVHHARGAAILLIVLAHTFDAAGFRGSRLADALSAALIDSTGLFLLIAGYLFQHLSAGFRFGPYLARKARNVFLPYAIISIPAIAIYLLHLKAHPTLPAAFFDAPAPVVIGRFLMTGQHLGPLWFIPMIAIFYAAAPLFIFLDRRPWAYVLLGPCLALSIVVERPTHDDAPLQAAAHFLAAYLAGMALSRFRPALERVSPQAAFALLAVTFALAAAPAVFAMPDRFHLAMKLPFFAALLICGQRAGARERPVLTYLGTVSFGIYFVHGYLTGALRWLTAPAGTAEPRLAFALAAFALVVAGSLAAVETVRRLSGPHSRLLIGV